MTETDFEKKAAAVWDQIQELQRRVRKDPARLIKVLPDACLKLQHAIEDVVGAHEEFCRLYQQLATAYEVMETERQHYQDLFEQAPDAYLVTDPGGVIQEANRAAAALLNTHLEELVGALIRDFLVKNEREPFVDYAVQLSRVEKMAEWEGHVRPTGGKPFLGAMTAAVMHDRRGRPSGLRWLLRDITERKGRSHSS